MPRRCDSRESDPQLEEIIRCVQEKGARRVVRAARGILAVDSGYYLSTDAAGSARHKLVDAGFSSVLQAASLVEADKKLWDGQNSVRYAF